MENQIKNKVKKRLAIYGTMILLGTTSFSLVGCGNQIVKEPTKIENVKDDKTEELTASEIGENEVTETNVVSENTVVSEDVVEEDGPVFTKSLTEEEIDEICNPAFEELTNNPPVDGIFNPDYDFSKSDSVYKNDKNYQKEYYLALDYAYGAAAGNKSIEENKNYTAIICKKGFTIYAAEETLSIITLNDNLEKYYIIKDYQGEDIILENSYLDFCTGDKLEENITNFNVTSMNDYLDKYDNGVYDRKPGSLLSRDYTDFAISQYKNIGKAK